VREHSREPATIADCVDARIGFDCVESIERRSRRCAFRDRHLAFAIRCASKIDVRFRRGTRTLIVATHEVAEEKVAQICANRAVRWVRKSDAEKNFFPARGTCRGRVRAGGRMRCERGMWLHQKCVRHANACDESV
jgi:hypothetical protein